MDKIGYVIGPKGKMINQIQEDTGAEIAIEDDGTVYISSEGGEAAEKAKQIIDEIANPHVPQAGETYKGTVVKTTSFGAFVNLLPGKDGLLHISRVAKGRVEKVEAGRRRPRQDLPGHPGLREPGEQCRWTPFRRPSAP